MDLLSLTKITIEHRIHHLLLVMGLVFFGLNLNAQCEWYTITVTDSPSANEVTWQLLDENGVQWVSGGAPYSMDICLPDGCYTLVMYDLGGNGWEDEDWIIEDWVGDFDFDTNLGGSVFSGYDSFELGSGGGCTGNPPGGGGPGEGCPTGTTEYILTLTSGTDPSEIAWDFTLGGTSISTGIAPTSDTLCLTDGCYYITLNDSGGDGWEGSTYTLAEAGVTIATGTLTSGSTEDQLINIGSLDCSVNPGGGCGSDPPSSDCSTAPCICDPYTFSITPSGWGSINDIPAAGSISNPAYGPANNAPWGGNDWGCLLAGELNSSWMVFTVANTGVLEFSFGANANGGQAGYYDWAMWTYNASTCSSISNNTLPPVRCLWNATSNGGTGLATTIPAGGNAGNYGPPLNVTAGDQYIICLSNWSYANANVTLDFFGTADVDCNILLPLEHLDLRAEQFGRNINVEWSTLNERNNDFFVLERSTTNNEWFAQGIIDGAGDSYQKLEYSFLDNDAKPGWNYYQLKQFDFDGHFSISEVVSVWMDAKLSSILSPNPVNSSLNINYTAVGKSTLSIMDASGRLVFSKKGVEIYPMEIDVSKLPDGVYHFTLQNSFDFIHEKLVVRH